MAQDQYNTNISKKAYQIREKQYQYCRGSSDIIAITITARQTHHPFTQTAQTACYPKPLSASHASSMSTPLGHFAAGTAIYFSYSRLRSRHTMWALPCFVLLAMLPDADYLTIWMFGIGQEPRVTHSLLFCVLAGTVAWHLRRSLHTDTLTSRPLSFAGFLLAPLSHLALDFLVGTHTVPIFWPLPNGELMSPLALLPSVIHAHSLVNFKLWRNTILEFMVLLPMLLFFVARARAVPLRSMTRTGILVLPFWLLCLICSISLAG